MRCDQLDAVLLLQTRIQRITVVGAVAAGDLEQAMLLLLNDGSLRNRIAQNTRQSVAHFSSDLMARGYLDFYQRMGHRPVGCSYRLVFRPKYSDTGEKKKQWTFLSTESSFRPSKLF